MSSLIEAGAGFQNVINEMLSDDVSKSIINQYFDKMSYYTLELARKIIERQGFKPHKERRLIADLKLIKERGGVADTKAGLSAEDKDDFNRSLRELAALGINPVTIPKEWGVKSIPNLLDTYYGMITESERENEIMVDYFKELRRKNPKPKKVELQTPGESKIFPLLLEKDSVEMFKSYL